MGPPRFQSRHSKNGPTSTNPDTSNGCQADDVRFDIGNGNQNDDSSFDIGNGNQSIDVRLNIGNRNQDDDARNDIANSNQGRDASFNVCDGILDGRDALDGGDAEVVELARAIKSLSTEGVFDSIRIYTAPYPIHVNRFLDVSCIPK